MKNARLTVLSGVLMSILVFGAAFAAAQGQWDVVIPKSIDGVKVRMAAFHNEKFGVWGGAGGLTPASCSASCKKSMIWLICRSVSVCS